MLEGNRDLEKIMTIIKENSFLRLENLSKSYQEGEHKRLVLRNVCANIDRGELIAIVGRSGSGKSTLLNIVSGIDSVDSGKILINGDDLTSLDVRQRTLYRRQHIGFIFQFFNLLPTLTVLENVTLPLELNGTSAQAAIQLAEPLLESVALLDRSGTYPDRLSGGEQQRVAIARALVNNPMILLADEPTGNLDAETGEAILILLDRLTRQAGKNLILVTHNKDAVAFADRILCLQDGVLIEQC
jgi:putative ABC transport system ATP-binding protein